MFLLADSGSTETVWVYVNPDNDHHLKIQASGINPMYQNEERIYRLLKREFIEPDQQKLDIHFYGAGCMDQGVNAPVQNALKRFFNYSSVKVYSDLLGAARSLCQDREGIACILGTGSNSCYYDGRSIVHNVSPLGYMLGDEGSGAVIGRKFIGNILKNQLPGNVRKLFFSAYDYTPQQIMEHVYKKTFPNRFLAQFTRFIHDHLDIPALRKLVKDEFIAFFDRNVFQYPEADRLPVHFTGSIAWHFAEILKEAAKETCFTIGRITESPMEGLIKYHLSHWEFV